MLACKALVFPHRQCRICLFFEGFAVGGFPAWAPAVVGCELSVALFDCVAPPWFEGRRRQSLPWPQSELGGHPFRRFPIPFPFLLLTFAPFAQVPPFAPVPGAPALRGNEGCGGAAFSYDLSIGTSTLFLEWVNDPLLTRSEIR